VPSLFYNVLPVTSWFNRSELSADLLLAFMQWNLIGKEWCRLSCALVAARPRGLGFIFFDIRKLCAALRVTRMYANLLLDLIALLYSERASYSARL
jgi:hypothetical protein